MKYRFLILTILCSLLLAGCKNSFLQKDSSEFVKVTITLNDNSRKLAPDSNKLNDFFSKLTYTLKVGDATEEITLNDCCDGTYSCEVQTGTYDLVLNAYDGRALIFSDRKEKVNLQEDVLLTFDLKITENSAPGCLSYYFSPVDFGSLDDNKLEKISDFTLTLNGDEYNLYNGFVKFDEEKDCYYFEMAGLPAGAYSMTLEYTFYGKEDYKIEEAVLIYPGFETTNDGNEFYYSKVYTITYHTDADIQNFCADDENFPKKYNPNDFNKIGSPLTGRAADEYIFLGWYYDEDFTKPLYKYYEEGKELYNFGEDTKVAGNIVLYSKIKRAVEIEYVVLDSEGNNFEDICNTKGYNLWRNNGRDCFIFNSINYGSINITEDDEISYKNYKSSICDENKNIYNFVDIYSQLEIHGEGDGELIPYYIENWYYDSSFNNPVDFVEFTDYFSGNTHRLIDTEKFLSKVEGTKLTIYAKVIDLYNLLVYEDGSEKPEVDDFIVPEYDFESKKLCFRYDLYPVADCAENESISFYYSDKECKNMLPYEFNYNGAVGFYYSTYDIVDKNISIYSKTIGLNDDTEVLKYVVDGKTTYLTHKDTFLGTKINIANPDIGDDETFIGWFYDEECTKELENEIEYNNKLYVHEKKSYITLTPDNFQSEITIYPKIIPNIKINYVLSDGTKIAKLEDITQNVIDNFNNIRLDFKEAIFVRKFNYDIDPIIKDKTNFFTLPILTDEYNGKIFERWYTDAEFKTTDNIVINNDQYCLAVDENNCKKDGYNLYAKYVYPLSITLSGYDEDFISIEWLEVNQDDYDKFSKEKFNPSDRFKLPQFNETENALEGWYISTINPDDYKNDNSYFSLKDVKEFNKDDELYYQIPSEYFSLTDDNVKVYITPKFEKGNFVALYNTKGSGNDTIWVTASDIVDDDSKHYTVENDYYSKDLVLTPEGDVFYTSGELEIGIYKNGSLYKELDCELSDVFLSYDDENDILWYLDNESSFYKLNGIKTTDGNNIYTSAINIFSPDDGYLHTFVVNKEANILYFIYKYYNDFFLTIFDLQKEESIYNEYLDLWLLGEDCLDNLDLFNFTDMYLYKDYLYIIFNYSGYSDIQSRGGIIQFNLKNNKWNRKITGWVSTPDTQVIHPSGKENEVYYFPNSINSLDLFGPQKIIGYKDDKQKLLLADYGFFYFTDDDGENYYKEVNRVVEFNLEENQIDAVKLFNSISFVHDFVSNCFFSSAD